MSAAPSASVGSSSPSLRSGSSSTQDSSEQIEESIASAPKGTTSCSCRHTLLLLCASTMFVMLVRHALLGSSGEPTTAGMGSGRSNLRGGLINDNVGDDVGARSGEDKIFGRSRPNRPNEPGYGSATLAWTPTAFDVVPLALDLGVGDQEIPIAVRHLQRPPAEPPDDSATISSFLQADPSVVKSTNPSVAEATLRNLPAATAWAKSDVEDSDRKGHQVNADRAEQKKQEVVRATDEAAGDIDRTANAHARKVSREAAAAEDAVEKQFEENSLKIQKAANAQQQKLREGRRKALDTIEERQALAVEAVGKNAEDKKEPIKGERTKQLMKIKHEKEDENAKVEKLTEHAYGKIEDNVKAVVAEATNDLDHSFIQQALSTADAGEASPEGESEPDGAESDALDADAAAAAADEDDDDDEDAKIEAHMKQADKRREKELAKAMAIDPAKARKAKPRGGGMSLEEVEKNEREAFEALNETEKIKSAANQIGFAFGKDGKEASEKKEKHLKDLGFEGKGALEGVERREDRKLYDEEYDKGYEKGRGKGRVGPVKADQAVKRVVTDEELVEKRAEVLLVCCLELLDRFVALHIHWSNILQEHEGSHSGDMHKIEGGCCR